MKAHVVLARAATVGTILIAAGCSRSIPRPLIEAQQFLRNAPAYQEKSTSETVSMSGTSVVRHRQLKQLQIVRGGALHAIEVYDGRLGVELITDGKREFGPSVNGEMEEEPGDAAKAFATQVKLSLWEVVPGPGDGSARLEAHGNVDGIAASIYTWSARSSVIVREAPFHWATVRPTPETTRIWIADDNHRPLKIERKVEVTAGMPEITTTIFSYDPAVHVTLPGQ